MSDYEAGTWTPTDESGAGLTFTDAAGNYVRIGDLVFIDWTVTYPDTLDMSWAKLSGLPFPPSATNRSFGVALASFPQTVYWSILSGGNWINLSASYGGDLYSNAGLRTQQLIFNGVYRV